MGQDLGTLEGGCESRAGGAAKCVVTGSTRSHGKPTLGWCGRAVRFTDRGALSAPQASLSGLFESPQSRQDAGGVALPMEPGLVVRFAAGGEPGASCPQSASLRSGILTRSGLCPF